MTLSFETFPRNALRQAQDDNLIVHEKMPKVSDATDFKTTAEVSTKATTKGQDYNKLQHESPGGNHKHPQIEFMEA